MKVVKIILVLTIFAGCNRVDNRIYGDWCVVDDYYTACYKIEQENGEIVGRVLHYNDGTSKYVYDSLNPKYAFKNIKYAGDKFVDGVTGATSSKKANTTLSITITNQDTLKVSSYLKKNHTDTEIWIRKNN